MLRLSDIAKEIADQTIEADAVEVNDGFDSGNNNTAPITSNALPQHESTTASIDDIGDDFPF